VSARIAVLVDTVTEARETFARATRSLITGPHRDQTSVFTSLRRQNARTAGFGLLNANQAAADSIIEIQSGRCRAPHRKGRGVQF